MNESFQIIATLAAVQIVLAMSPGPAGRFVARAGLRDPGCAVAAALGLWSAATFLSILAFALLATVSQLLPELAFVLRLACGAHLARLAVVAVRRSFADHETHTLVPLAVSGRREAFAVALRGILATPSALAFHVAVLGLTGATDLGGAARLLAVLTMPTVALAWHLLVAVSHADDHRPHPGTPLASGL